MGWSSVTVSRTGAAPPPGELGTEGHDYAEDHYCPWPTTATEDRSVAGRRRLSDLRLLDFYAQQIHLQ